jgi:hypothetical protein
MNARIRLDARRRSGPVSAGQESFFMITTTNAVAAGSAGDAFSGEHS